MDRRQNLLIGFVVAIIIVGATVYATGLTGRLLSPFGTSSEYESSKSATAPKLASGSWINSEPLKLESLRGRVVLIEFWTFGCFNCRNTVPFVKSWHDRYREQGLTVIGVHSPETAEESRIEDVRREVASLGINYPVVTDNDLQTWNAYDAYAWPTIFLLDKQGRIRWMRVGEGNYDETERLIQKLLAEK
jgi:thiol-disulfide isomerase/thioredoxin